MASHGAFLLPAMFAGAILLAGCSDPVEPLPDATAPPPALDPIPPEYDEHPAPPLDGAGGVIATLCEPLSQADALEFSEEATSAGTIGSSELLGSRNDLACSEPYPDEHVECEIRAGGTAFLKKGDDVSGLRNTSGATAILAVTPETMGCNPLAPPDVDPGRRPL